MLTKKMSFSCVSIQLLILVFSLCNAQTEVGNRTFQVGVILDLNSLVGRMGITSLSLALSDFYSVNTNYTTKLGLHVRNTSGQAIDAAASALDLLKNVGVDAIIGPQNSAQASLVIGLGDRASVPFISFSATSPSINPRSHYFVQAAIGDAAQVGAIAAIVEHFKWNQVVIISEDSDYGNGIILHLSNALQDINSRISYRSAIPSAATEDMMLKELYKMKTMQTRVFVVHVSSSLASRFFPKVKEAGMMSKGYAWIVTSGIMDLLYSTDSNAVDSMQGVIGVKPLIPRSKKLRNTAIRWKRKFLDGNPEFSKAELGLYGVWAYDTLWALSIAAERVQFREPSFIGNSGVLNSTDMFTTEVSRTGPNLLEAILGVTFEGLGGNVHLGNGKLEAPSFQILNVIGKGEREVGIWISSQGILSEKNVNVSNSSNITMKNIVFPGESTTVPKGWEIPVGSKKLRIGVPVEAGFPEMVRVTIDPQTNASTITGCYIEMFDAVMAKLPYAVPYEYLPFGKLNDSTALSYDEFTRQVFLQNFDGAVGDITITSKRSSFVDFTLPFSDGGVKMVISYAYDNTNENWNFLKPFQKNLWLSAIAVFLFTGFSLWILEHRFNSDYRGPLAQHAGMILYFPFMSLVFAQRERIVTNLARLVVVAWVFIVLLLNSTYTASLSAMLTVQGLKSNVTDVTELIRGGDYVGYRAGSFIYEHLQATGFEKSKIKPYKHPEDVDEALSKGSKGGGISAFFSTTPYSNLFLSRYCDKYMTASQVYPTEGHAFVFPRSSPLAADVSRAITELTEKGSLDEMDGRCMKHYCNVEVKNRLNSKFLSVPLKKFRIPFAVTGAVTTMCLFISLATYMYKNRDFFHRISNSNATAWSKVRAISKHFDQRDPKSFRSSRDNKEDEDLTSPSSARNPGFDATVVPVSDIEMRHSHGDTSPHSEDTNLASSTTPPENVTSV